MTPGPIAKLPRWGSHLSRETGSRAVLSYAPRPVSVVEILAYADNWGDREFIVQGSRRITFRRLHESLASAAGHLARAGVRPGDRVLIHGFNSPEWLLALCATWWLGAVPVLTNRWWSDEELDRATVDVEARLVVTDRAGGPATRTMRLDELGGAFDHRPGDTEPLATAFDESAPGLILFTSGSTGAPRGVVLSHKAVLANQHNILARARRLTPEIVEEPPPPRDVTLVAGPLFHVGALSTALTKLITGGTLVLLEGRFDARRVLALIEAERVTHWGGVPTLARRVLEHPDFASFDLNSLRSVPLGGAPVSDDLWERLRSALPHLRRGLAGNWGLSESGGLLTLATSTDLLERPGTVGRPYPVVEIRVLSPDADGVGELLVRSPTVMTGYYGSGGDDVGADGWLHTGDLGTVDDAGYVYITGRSKDVIIRGGENIAAAHVEAVLVGHPSIREAAVFGVPDTDVGERVAAVVVLADGARIDLDELRDYARAQLAHFEVPGAWQVRKEPLPLLVSSGKIDKNRVRNEFEPVTH